MTTPAANRERGMELLTPIPLGELSDEPLVSILVSNYNYGHLASTAIESALGQSYERLELILCDDGSTDDSRRVFERYAEKDSRIKLVFKGNGGQASGFNAAFEYSRGEILCFLDTDDRYRPNKVARVVQAFRENREAGCVVNRLMRGDAELKPQGLLPLFAKLPSGWCGPKVLENGGILSDMPGTPGLNFRRTIAYWLFPLPEYSPLGAVADMTMMRLAPLLTPIASIDEPLADFRLHNRNTYQRAGLTQESLARELDICEHLWRAQRELLFRLNADAAQKLLPIDADRGIVQERYMLSRLRHDPAASAHHRELMRRSWPDRPWARWFWLAAAYLPGPAFQAAINLVMAQNQWKQMASKLRGARVA